MKLRCKFAGLSTGCLVLLLASGPSLHAQTMSCPPFGWAEGLVHYTGFEAKFPTEDTKNNPATDCAFHEWSWEAFVWATALVPTDPANLNSPVAPRFLTLPDLDALGDSAHPELAKIGPKPLMLRPRTTKARGSQQGISGIQQAGSEGILIDQNGQAVYYSQHANPTYYDFVQKYYGIANYDKASPTQEFPVGAAVFKASWHIIPDGADTTGFYTTKATVPMLINSVEGVAEIDPSGKTREVTVALVGLHVVGTTENHPEFLWATFEQLQNAPDLPPNSNPTHGPVVPVSNKNFTFYKANTMAADCNQLPAKETVADVSSQTLTPITNVYRQFAYGGENAVGEQEIEAINAQSQGAVKGFPQAMGGATWANYRLIGTVWLHPNTLKPGDGDMDTEAVGSVSLADATMESFVQGAGTNCFTCHSSGGNAQYNIPGKDINLSHKILQPFFSDPALKQIVRRVSASNP